MSFSSSSSSSSSLALAPSLSLKRWRHILFGIQTSTGAREMKGIASCHRRDQCVVSVLFKILGGELEGEEKNERKVKGGINAINLEEQRRERDAS